MKGNGKRILSVFLTAMIAITTVGYAPPFTSSASWKTNMEKALELLASPSDASKQGSTATPSQAESPGRDATPSEAETTATPSEALKKFVRVEPEEIPEYYSQASASGKRFWKFEDRNGMVQYRDYGYLQGDAEFPLWYVTDLTGTVDDTSVSVNLDEEYYSVAPYIYSSVAPDQTAWADLSWRLFSNNDEINDYTKKNISGFENWDSSGYDIWHLLSKGEEEDEEDQGYHFYGIIINKEEGEREQEPGWYYSDENGNINNQAKLLASSLTVEPSVIYYNYCTDKYPQMVAPHRTDSTEGMSEDDYYTFPDIQLSGSKLLGYTFSFQDYYDLKKEMYNLDVRFKPQNYNYAYHIKNNYIILPNTKIKVKYLPTSLTLNAMWVPDNYNSLVFLEEPDIADKNNVLDVYNYENDRFVNEARPFSGPYGKWYMELVVVKKNGATFNSFPSGIGHANKFDADFAGWVTEDGKKISSWTAGSGGNITYLFPNWVANKYTVTFKDDNGNIIGETQTVISGQPAIEPENIPIKEGYRFIGWDKDFSVIKENMVITAQYKLNNFKVTFKDWDGAVLSSQDIATGGAAIAPDNPKREGYTFTGWNKAYNSISEDTVITAQYKQNGYAVEFVDYNHDILKVENVEYGESATPPLDPSRTGYHFDGWDGAYTNVKSNITIKARYSPILYWMYYYGNGETSGNMAFSIFEYDKSRTLIINTFKKTGYKFIGWNTKIDGTGDTYSDEQVILNITPVAGTVINLYAQWEKSAGIVRFLVYDGTLLKEQMVTLGSDATPPTVPERPGYTFIGWDKSYDNIQTDIVLTAQYEISSHSLTLDGNGGSLSSNSTLKMDVSAGESLDQVLTDGKNQITRKYYTFRGWYTDPFAGIKYPESGNRMPDADLTVYARWERSSNEVTFKDWNGAVLDRQEVSIGADATPPEVPERPGYTFTGWGKPTTNIQNHTDITAQYSINRYLLTLDGNGGTLEGSTQKAIQINYEGSYDQALTDGRDQVIRKYYIFDGWYSSPTGGTKYNYTGSIMPDSNITVYAHWVHNSSEVVHKDWNGAILKTQEVAIGTDATPPKDPVRPGYAFSGWDKPSTNIQNHTTITAQYISNRFMLTLDGNGGTLAGDETKSQMLSFGDAMDQVLTDGAGKVNRKYYAFDGWHTMPTGGSKYTGSGNTMPASSVTVYAHWVRNSSEVVYKDWNGDVLKTQEVAIGTDATPPKDPVRPGYAFTGWDKPSTNIQNHTTITALYTAGDYKQTTEEKSNVAPVLVPPTIDTTTKPIVPDNRGTFIVNPEDPYDVTYTKPGGTPAKNEWVGNGKDWYHVDEEGKINYDWYLEGEKTWYKLNQEKGDRFGAALIGWNHESMDDRRYFFDPSTTKMLTGWQKIDGKSYYFTTKNEGQTYFGSNRQGGSNSQGWTYDSNRPGKPYGSMYQNEYTPDGYFVDENGVCVDKK